MTLCITMATLFRCAGQSLANTVHTNKTHKLRVPTFVLYFPLHVSFIHMDYHQVEYSILIRSNKMQQYAGIYLLQNYSTCFGCPSHPSSGVHKTVTATSGTSHNIWATTFLHRGLIWPLWRKVVALIRDMTCTRSCSYSFMYSWWWVR